MSESQDTQATSSSHQGGSDAPRKGKQTNLQKMFDNRLSAALESTIKIHKMKKLSSMRHTFNVTNHATSRTNYEVQISNVSSCTCRDYRLHGAKVFCKHILFVCLVALDGAGLKEAMQARYLSDDDLKVILSKKIDEKYKSSVKATKQKKDFLTILQNHEDYNMVQAWKAQKRQRVVQIAPTKMQSSFEKGQ